MSLPEGIISNLVKLKGILLMVALVQAESLNILYCLNFPSSVVSSTKDDMKDDAAPPSCMLLRRKRKSTVVLYRPLGNLAADEVGCRNGFAYTYDLRLLFEESVDQSAQSPHNPNLPQLSQDHAVIHDGESIGNIKVDDIHVVTTLFL